MTRDVVKSECRTLKIRSCSNLQHLLNTRFVQVADLEIEKCDVTKDTFKIFGGEALQTVLITQSRSFDDEVARYLALDSPFMKI